MRASHMNESNRFLGIAYLDTIITAVFLLASYLPIFFYYKIDKYDMKAFSRKFPTDFQIPYNNVLVFGETEFLIEILNV